MELPFAPAPVRRCAVEDVRCRSVSGPIARIRLSIGVANINSQLVKRRTVIRLDETLKIIELLIKHHIGCHPSGALRDSLILRNEFNTERKRRCTTKTSQCVSENGSVAKSRRQVIKILRITRIETRNSYRTAL